MRLSETSNGQFFWRTYLELERKRADDFGLGFENGDRLDSMLRSFNLQRCSHGEDERWVEPSIPRSEIFILPLDSFGLGSCDSTQCGNEAGPRSVLLESIRLVVR